MRQQGEFLFYNVHKALETAFNVQATAGSIKCAAYEVPTAAATIKDKKTLQDRHTESVWILEVAKGALTALEWAWVTCTYDGAGQARDDALQSICDAYASLHGNAKLLAGCVRREFIFGESYCPSYARVAKDAGCSKEPAVRVGGRVEKAMRELGRQTSDKLNAAFAAKGWVPRRAA